MQQARRTLSIRVPEPEPELPPLDRLVRAIEQKRCVVAVYNKAVLKLAPHILYTRHDDPFVDAVVVEREGKAPRETKLGTFKLAGLSDLQPTTAAFTPLALFDRAAPLYAGATIRAVDP